MPTKQDIYNRLDELVSDAHKVACSLDVGEERTEAFALYTVLHRLLRRGAAVHIHDAINPLLVDQQQAMPAIIPPIKNYTQTNFPHSTYGQLLEVRDSEWVGALARHGIAVKVAE